MERSKPKNKLDDGAGLARADCINRRHRKRQSTCGAKRHNPINRRQQDAVDKMKSPAIERFRRKLAADEPVYGLWVTLESASLSEMGVGLGLDWIVVDAEHGHLDWKDVLDHIRAAVRSETVMLVRITELNA